MKLEDNDRALIEKFLDGELSEEETRLFEEREKSSTEFRASLAFQRQLLGHMEAQQKSVLKSELAGMMNEVQTSANSSTPWRTIWVAASVLLVIGFVGILQLLRPSKSEQLFEQYFDPYPVLNVVRGDTPSGLNPLRVYTEGKYELFVESIEKGQSNHHALTNQFHLAHGNALLAISKPRAAIEAFHKIPEGDDHYLDAQWYLVLSHLQLQQHDESRKLLEQLIEQQTFYTSSAKKLLQELEEL